MPKIGLLSDSHGQAAITRQAVALLVQHGAQALIHLGDVGSMQVIDALAGLDIPAYLTFGNTDWDASSLARYAQSLDIQTHHPIGWLNLTTLEAGSSTTAPQTSLVFTHGDDPCLIEQALTQQACYLCHGHTHKQTDQRIQATRLINPGALDRANRYTVALLDTENDQLRFYLVSESC